eukprot:3224816-Prymnesium_polylepis.1
MGTDGLVDGRQGSTRCYDCDEVRADTHRTQWTQCVNGLRGRGTRTWHACGKAGRANDASGAPRSDHTPS